MNDNPPGPPTRFCDIVMKGGITSGVVYPLAVLHLSEEFRFKRIGGTSAGAIAAALTAAAEYRRMETGSDAGFRDLGGLPEFLGGRSDGQSNLLSLFPPAPGTRRLFHVLTAFLGKHAMVWKVALAAGRLLLMSPLLAILALLPAVLASSLLLARPSWQSFVALAIFVVPSAIGGLIILALYHAVHGLMTTLPKHGYGFSTGKTPADRKLPGVADWLHQQLQQAAGRGLDDAPLTFGDLWAAGVPADERKKVLDECRTDPRKRVIDLQMITTALSQGRPYRLPFESDAFSFKDAEFMELFPASLVNHMIASVGPAAPDGTRPLPSGADLPVLVAARMSLSFPVLFSMVPLYAIDYSLKENQGDSPRTEICWFVDGGLSSNFPITLFDRPMPAWPTFGINLTGFHPDHPKDPMDESRNVWMVPSHKGGVSERWLRFDGILGYGSAVLDSIRNWRDNTQMAVPGFRDRIAHVKLEDDEGGLNLEMDGATVDKLSKRGHFAGVLLRERFGAAGARPEGMTWSSHRWVRLRNSIPLLLELLRDMAEAFDSKETTYSSYEDLLDRKRDEDPETGYWWKGKPEEHRRMIHEVLTTARRLAPYVDKLALGAPRPRPEIRISPRL